MSLSPLEIIFSCSICQANLPSLTKTNPPLDGIRQHPGSKPGSVPKLWLTSCAHVICRDCIKDGGPAFYQENSEPKAPCPLCSQEKDDASDKTLFQIDALEDGQVHDEIPSGYFQFPPPGLAGDGAEMQGLRFQFVSLLRFAVQTKIKLNKWTDREVQIRRCIEAVGLLHGELASVRSLLKEKGYETSSIDKVLHDVAKDPTKMASDASGRASNSTLKADVNDQQPHIQIDLAQGSAADLRAMSHRLQYPQTYDLPGSNLFPRQQSRAHDPPNSSRRQMLSSRDEMPPPILPKQNRAFRQPLDTSSSGVSERSGHDLPSIDVPTRHIGIPQWAPLLERSQVSSRHFMGAEKYRQDAPPLPTFNPRLESTITPQKRQHSSMFDTNHILDGCTPMKIQYGQNTTHNERPDSTFDMINSPHKRSTLGLYASQSYSPTALTTSSNIIQPHSVENGMLTEYLRDSSTPRTSRLSNEVLYSNNLGKSTASRHSRGEKSHRSLMDELRTSPSRNNHSAFGTDLQSFAYQGDPVDAYLQQRSLRQSTAFAGPQYAAPGRLSLPPATPRLGMSAHARVGAAPTRQPLGQQTSYAGSKRPNFSRRRARR